MSDMDLVSRARTSVEFQNEVLMFCAAEAAYYRQMADEAKTKGQNIVYTVRARTIESFAQRLRKVTFR